MQNYLENLMIVLILYIIKISALILYETTYNCTYCLELSELYVQFHVIVNFIQNYLEHLKTNLILKLRNKTLNCIELFRKFCKF